MALLSENCWIWKSLEEGHYWEYVSMHIRLLEQEVAVEKELVRMKLSEENCYLELQHDDWK